MALLSVNINKFALLRNSRGTNNPDLEEVAKKCIECGAQGITLHPVSYTHLTLPTKA